MAGGIASINQKEIIENVSDDDLIVVTLADGSTKRVKKKDLYSSATSERSGLMTATDKQKLSNQKIYTGTVDRTANKAVKFTLNSSYHEVLDAAGGACLKLYISDKAAPLTLPRGITAKIEVQFSAWNASPKYTILKGGANADLGSNIIGVQVVVNSYAHSVTVVFKEVDSQIHYAVESPSLTVQEVDIPANYVDVAAAGFYVNGTKIG